MLMNVKHLTLHRDSPGTHLSVLLFRRYYQIFIEVSMKALRAKMKKKRKTNKVSSSMNFIKELKD